MFSPPKGGHCHAWNTSPPRKIYFAASRKCDESPAVPTARVDRTAMVLNNVRQLPPMAYQSPHGSPDGCSHFWRAARYTEEFLKKTSTSARRDSPYARTLEWALLSPRTANATQADEEKEARLSE
jgi:hypothetical protein